MAHELDGAATERLGQYFQLVASRHLKDRRQRECFAVYAYGIWGESERKSLEPIARPGAGEGYELANDPRSPSRTSHSLAAFSSRPRPS